MFINKTDNICLKTDISDIVKYLIGVSEEQFYYYPESMKIYEKLHHDSDSRKFRLVSILLNKMLIKYRDTKYNLDNLINIDRQELYKETVSELNSLGLNVVIPNAMPDEYIYSFNMLKSKLYHNIKDIFPEWVNKEYIKSFLISKNSMPKKNSDYDMSKYKYFWAHSYYYPYQCFVCCTPKESDGNLLLNDEKFLTYLYKVNNDVFDNISKVRDIGIEAENKLITFFENSESIFISVDAENSDFCRTVSFIKHLKSEYLEKIKRIDIYDDINTGCSWHLLNDVTNINVSYHLTERTSVHKSVVDAEMMLDIADIIAKNDNPSIMIFSSDCDYWTVVKRNTNRCNFFFMVESEKFGLSLKEKLLDNNIDYVYINDFDSSEIFAMQKSTIKNRFLDKINSSTGDFKQMVTDSIRELRFNICKEDYHTICNEIVNNLSICMDEKNGMHFKYTG